MAGRKICAANLKAEDLEGKKFEVKYEANGVDQWQLFFDGEKLHLITANCVKRELLDMTGYHIKGRKGEYTVHHIYSDRDSLINWLKDLTKWSKFASGISGAKAVGAPTVEQFCGCWNVMNQHQKISPNDGWIDLKRPGKLFFPHKKELCDGYWLVSTDSSRVWYVDDNGNVYDDYVYDDYGKRGVRPLVTPLSDIGLEYDEELEMWLIV